MFFIAILFSNSLSHKKYQKQYKEFSRTLRSASSNDNILHHHRPCQNQDFGIDLMLLGTDLIWMPRVFTGSLLTLFTLREFIVL